MDPSDSLRALQSHLSNARILLSAGDRRGALEAVDAALAIDPEFLAALASRDRIAAAPAAEAAAPPPPLPAVMSAPPPLVSAEGFARFEERDRRRRVGRRVEAARTAIEQQRLKEARVFINEIRQLDGNLPELPALVAALAEAKATRTMVRAHGPWIVTAAAVVALVLIAPSWNTDTRALPPHPLGIIDPVVAPSPALSGLLLAASNLEAAEAVDVEASGIGDPIQSRPRVFQSRPRVRSEVSSVSPSVLPPVAEVTPALMRTPPITPPVVVAAIELAPIPSAATAKPPAPEPFSAPPPRPGPEPVTPLPRPVADVTPAPRPIADEELVHRTLQQYRRAYEGLDAQSAQNVWPAVNEAALARAFDGLQSQNLNFDDCNVQLRGEAAQARCLGSARYVPKVGSHQPRIEPRIWNFTLRKQGADWKIETARTER